MWALATPLRLSRASTSSSALRSFASSLPRSLEELPSQERITSSSQAGQETELEAQRGEEAQWSSQVAETGEAMASKAEKVTKTSSGPPPKGWRKVWAENKEKKKAYLDMAEYGSYQTDSTWEPARALTNPPSAHDVTLSHLMASQAHLGHHPGLTRSSYHPYLAGRRGGVDIIDLSATLPSLRKACGVVRDISRDDGVIVFMGRRHVTKSPVWRAVSRMPGVGHAVTERWRPGSLTNAASVFGSEYVLNGSYLPDLVVVADPRNMHMLIKECNLKNVPTMGIVDTDVDPRIVTYPIFANAESNRSLELIFGALGRAGEEGIGARKGLLPGNQYVVQPGQFQAKIDNKRDPEVMAYSKEQHSLWREMYGVKKETYGRGASFGGRSGGDRRQGGPPPA